jgi:hypothetical protein
VIKSWFVPPLVVPLALFLSLVTYATVLAFQGIEVVARQKKHAA